MYRRRVLSASGALVLLLALVAPVSAHHLVVDPPGEGGGTSHWVGGGPVPGGGAGLIPSPLGMLPAAHAAGLVMACMSTNENPSVAHFAAPPFFTGCQHGRP